MAEYSVAFASSAEKELKKLPAQLVARLVPHLENLLSNPRPSGSKKLRGGDGEWRIRIGDYRVVYTNRRRRIAGGGDANPSPKRGIQTMSALRALVPTRSRSRTMHCSPCYADFLSAREQLRPPGEASDQSRRLPKRVERRIARALDGIEGLLKSTSR